jgi:fructokinase
MNKPRLLSIGELLIDFTSSGIGSIEQIASFTKHPGGAPANVAVQYAKLGGRAGVITQLGKDGFGRYLETVLKANGVDTSMLSWTDEAPTGLAFVALDANGNRDFVFYRQPSSDLLYDKKQLRETWFQSGDILHFCSVDLVPSPMKEAHDQALRYAKAHSMMISFDPNLRFALWSDHQLLRQTIWAYLPLANIVKVSIEEAIYLTGSEEPEDWNRLLVGDVQLLLITKGSLGAELRTKTHRDAVEGIVVNAIDTTGAGDAFIGSFLYHLTHMGNNSTPGTWTNDELRNALTFANKVAAIVVTAYGAIPSMPSLIGGVLQ